nr:VC0807 family protein [uncultured Cohaesibacter sp.]
MLNDILISAGLPYLTYLILSSYGVPTVTALAVGSVFPIASIVVAFVRSRRIQAIGILTLSATMASVITSLYFNSAYLALAKGSLITGCVGLVFGLSLLAPRPLIFYLESSDAEGRARAETLWQTAPQFRKVMRLITVVWCIGLLGEASQRLVLIPLLPVDVFLPVSEVMWIACFGLLMAWSYRYGHRKMAKAAG